MLRGVLGAVVGGVAKLLALWGYQVPVLGFLGTTSLSFVVGSALFGWSGLLGTTAVHAFWAFWRDTPVGYPLVSAVIYFVAGAVVYQVFLHVPGIGRGFPNLKSVVWFGAASAAGALLSSTLISALYERQTFWASAGMWARSTVVSVWAFGPALLLVGVGVLHPWLVPIPGEAERARGSRYTLRDGGPRGVEVLPWESRSLGASMASGCALLVGVALVTLAIGRFAPGANHWLGVLYLIPIYWATRAHRLVGGLMAAAGTGVALLAVEVVEQLRTVAAEGADRQLEIYVYLLVFVAVGVLLGSARERETRLLEALHSGNQRLRQDLDRVVRALTGAVEAKDLYTEGHLHRVSEYALEVGRRLGLCDDDLEHLRIASALHDVGKIGVPEHILNKPGPLNAAERAIIERHPEIGARILDAVEGLTGAAPLVLYHQERWDGSRDGSYPGYPTGISGEAIPLGARIIAVVDAFDAMTTDRAYRGSLPFNRAVDELRAKSGRQFDPRVVDAFVGLLGERPWG